MPLCIVMLAILVSTRSCKKRFNYLQDDLFLVFYDEKEFEANNNVGHSGFRCNIKGMCNPKFQPQKWNQLYGGGADRLHKSISALIFMPLKGYATCRSWVMPFCNFLY